MPYKTGVAVLVELDAAHLALAGHLVADGKGAASPEDLVGICSSCSPAMPGRRGNPRNPALRPCDDDSGVPTDLDGLSAWKGVAVSSP